VESAPPLPLPPPPPPPQHGLDRLPVVDAARRCVGILTRSDFFWTLVGACARGVAPPPPACPGVVPPPPLPAPVLPGRLSCCV
jgi:hypothetical protein